MIERHIKNSIQELTKYYPIVTVMGSRQSGKSTLVKDMFPNYKYIDLEEKNALTYALDDPKGFILGCKGNTIIDEAQLAPEIFSSIKVAVDQNRENGKFILSGSQNFLLSKNINQSLAGRVGISELLPLSYRELCNSVYECSVEDAILKGGYPGLYTNRIPTHIFYKNYVKTYIERDASSYQGIRNIVDYENFIKLLASNVGQLLNYSCLSRNIGVDLNTIKSWLSMLVSSYIIYIIPAYSTNIKKRIVKSPKIYFADTGLLCYLLDIYDIDTLLSDRLFGLIFENFVVAETIKKYNNRNIDYSLFFYRDTNKNEIDLVDLTNRINPLAIEIKSGLSMQKKFNNVLKNADSILNIPNIIKNIIYRGDSNFRFQDTDVLRVEDYLLDNYN